VGFHCLYANYPFYLRDFIQIQIFSTGFFLISPIIYDNPSRGFVLLGAELLTDGKSNTRKQEEDSHFSDS